MTCRWKSSQSENLTSSKFCHSTHSPDIRTLISKWSWRRCGFKVSEGCLCVNVHNEPDWNSNLALQFHIMSQHPVHHNVEYFFHESISLTYWLFLHVSISTTNLYTITQNEKTIEPWRSQRIKPLLLVLTTSYIHLLFVNSTLSVF